MKRRKKKIWVAPPHYICLCKASVSCIDEALSEKECLDKFRKFIDEKLCSHDAPDGTNVRIMFVQTKKTFKIILYGKLKSINKVKNLSEDLSNEMFSSEIVEFYDRIPEKHKNISWLLNGSTKPYKIEMVFGINSHIFS